MLSCFIGSHASHLGVYTNLVIDDHTGAKAVWHVHALEFVILALIQFLVVAERAAVSCHDPRRVHGLCGVNTSLSSGVRLHMDHYGFVQIVTGCTFDHAPAYHVYRRSSEIHRLSLRSSDCSFLYTLFYSRVHRFFPPRSPRISAPPVANLCFLRSPLCTSLLGSSMSQTNASLLTPLRIRLPPRSDEAAPPYLPLRLASLLMPWM